MPSKQERIGIYLSRDEKKAIKKNAEKYNLTVSKFLTFAGSRDELPIAETERKQKEKLEFDLLRELNKAGNNLNQIAKALNYSRLADTQPPTETEINEVLRLHKQALKKLLAEK